MEMNFISRFLKGLGNFIIYWIPMKNGNIALKWFAKANGHMSNIPSCHRVVASHHNLRAAVGLY